MGITAIDAFSLDRNWKEYAGYYYVGPTYCLRNHISGKMFIDASVMIGYSYLDNRLRLGKDPENDGATRLGKAWAHGFACSVKCAVCYPLRDGSAIGIVAALKGHSSYEWHGDDADKLYFEPMSGKKRNNFLFPSIGVSYLF